MKDLKNNNQSSFKGVLKQAFWRQFIQEIICGLIIILMLLLTIRG